MESLPKNQEQRLQEPHNLVDIVNNEIEIIRSLEDLDQEAARETIEAAFKAKLVLWYFEKLSDHFQYAAVIGGNKGKPKYKALAIVKQTPIGHNGTPYDELDKLATLPEHQGKGLSRALIGEIRGQSEQGYFLRARPNNYHYYEATGHTDLSKNVLNEGRGLVAVYSPETRGIVRYNIFGCQGLSRNR